MLRESIYILFGVLFLAFVGNAQPMSGYPYKIMLETADEALDNFDYYNALEWFEKAYDEKKSEELAYTIGHLNMLLRDYVRAERWFSRLVRNRRATLEYPEATFYYARMLKQGGKYEDAEKQFLAYLNREDANDSILRLAKLEYDGLVLIKDLKPVSAVAVEPIESINYKNADTGPYLYNPRELYYSTFASDSVIVLDEDDVDFEAKIYKSVYDEEEETWGEATELGLQINRIGYHTSNPTFSSDRQRMYFTRAVLYGQQIVESKIYVSIKDGNDWSPAEPLKGGINGNFITTHPGIGALYGREVLFFSCNKEGGEGGFDLYFSTVLDDYTVSEPVNLGPEINSFLDEITPSYRDGNLYFSSNGRPGYGGFDLFMTQWDGSEWSEVVNMGEGFNSPADDMHLYLDETMENGFLVSNREGSKFLKAKTCCDDIFSVSPAKVPINLLATIGERRGGLRGGRIRILELKEEDTFEVISEQNNDSNQFDLSLNRDKSYVIIAEHPRYFPDTIKINTVGVTTEKTYKRKFVLEIKPPKEEEVELITINEPVRLNNIYYDYDDDKILPDAEKDLDLLFDLLEQYPTMVIELSSHTDSRGSDSYNMALSERRAISAKNYLVGRGADVERIKAVGYGETQILNECYNDVECSEEDHQYNRRTEFKIIEGPETIELKKQVTPEELAKMEAEKKKREEEEAKRRIIEQQKRKLEAERQKAKGEPGIKFDNMEVNFGRMKQGDKKAFTFTFINTGTADLEIEMVSACECTTVEYPTKPIKPGQKGQIKMLFDSTDEPGMIEKTLDVIHNCKPPVTELKYKANVMER